MPEPSWDSVQIISIDVPEVRRALARLVAELSARPEVVKIVLFGSMATGRFAPGSDVDLLIVLSESIKPFSKPFHQRILDYLPRRFPVDIDVFPYTEAETQRLSLPAEALRTGEVLWERPGSGATGANGDDGAS